MLKTAKPPKIVVCIRPSTWEAWCILQVTTLAYRHLSGAGCLSGLASFNLAKPEKTQKITKKSSPQLSRPQEGNKGEPEKPSRHNKNSQESRPSFLKGLREMFGKMNWGPKNLYNWPIETLKLDDLQHIIFQNVLHCRVSDKGKSGGVSRARVSTGGEGLHFLAMGTCLMCLVVVVVVVGLWVTTSTGEAATNVVKNGRNLRSHPHIISCQQSAHQG